MNCNNNNNNNELTAKSRPHVLLDVLSNVNKRVCDEKDIVAKMANCSIDVTYFMCSDPSKWK